jgi:hypothetical protein
MSEYTLRVTYPEPVIKLDPNISIFENIVKTIKDINPDKDLSLLTTSNSKIERYINLFDQIIMIKLVSSDIRKIIGNNYFTFKKCDLNSLTARADLVGTIDQPLDSIPGIPPINELPYSIPDEYTRILMKHLNLHPECNFRTYKFTTWKDFKVINYLNLQISYSNTLYFGSVNIYL